MVQLVDRALLWPCHCCGFNPIIPPPIPQSEEKNRRKKKIREYKTSSAGCNFMLLTLWENDYFYYCWQMCAGASMLTDVVFWLIIFPFLTYKEYKLNFVSIVYFEWYFVHCMVFFLHCDDRKVVSTIGWQVEGHSSESEKYADYHSVLWSLLFFHQDCWLDVLTINHWFIFAFGILRALRINCLSYNLTTKNITEWRELSIIILRRLICQSHVNLP